MDLIPPQAAVRSPRVRWAMAGVVTLVVAADQVTKSLVLSGRIAGDAGWAAVRLVRNTGSAGGLAAGYPVLVFLLALAITAFAVTLAVRARGVATALAFSFVVAGAIGNLSDRLFRAPGLGRGAVVDWIHFSGRGGSLNLSDLAINVGVFGAVIAMLAIRQKTGSAKPVRDATSN